MTGLAAFGLVPYIVLTALARVRLERGGAVGGLMAGLAETPDPGLRCADELARALGDESLTLAYLAARADRYVDSRGQPVELPRRARAGR